MIPMSWRDRLKAWLVARLDNDSVRPWVPAYCAAWLVWAVLATFWFPPVPIIEPIMGHAAYVMWVWLAIPGNLAPIVGLWMRHGGSPVQDMSSLLLLRDWMGLGFQVTGHAICHVLLLMFEVCAIVGVVQYDGPAAYPGMTVFAAVMLVPWTIGVAGLCAQCLRKVQRGLQLESAAIVRLREAT